jgi:hypothetical protein
MAQQFIISESIGYLPGSATVPVFTDPFYYKHDNYDTFLYGLRMEYGLKSIPVNLGIQASYAPNKTIQKVNDSYSSYQKKMKMCIIGLTCDYEKRIFKNISVRGGVSLNGSCAIFSSYCYSYLSSKYNLMNKDVIYTISPGLTAGLTYTLNEHILFNVGINGRFFIPRYKYLIGVEVDPSTQAETRYYETAKINKFQPYISIGYIFKR